LDVAEDVLVGAAENGAPAPAFGTAVQGVAWQHGPVGDGRWQAWPADTAGSAGSAGSGACLPRLLSAAFRGG
jgi:hypothetical protein